MVLHIWVNIGSGNGLLPIGILTAPSHYWNQCLLIVSKVHWHSFKANFTSHQSVKLAYNLISHLKFHLNLTGANELNEYPNIKEKTAVHCQKNNFYYFDDDDDDDEACLIISEVTLLKTISQEMLNAFENYTFQINITSFRATELTHLGPRKMADILLTKFAMHFLAEYCSNLILISITFIPNSPIVKNSA